MYVSSSKKQKKLNRPPAGPSFSPPSLLSFVGKSFSWSSQFSCSSRTIVAFWSLRSASWLSQRASCSAPGENYVRSGDHLFITSTRMLTFPPWNNTNTEMCPALMNLKRKHQRRRTNTELKKDANITRKERQPIKQTKYTVTKNTTARTIFFLVQLHTMRGVL